MMQTFAPLGQELRDRRAFRRGFQQFKPALANGYHDQANLLCFNRFFRRNRQPEFFINAFRRRQRFHRNAEMIDAKHKSLASHVGPDAFVWASEQSSPVLAFPKSHATGPELRSAGQVRAPALGLTSHSTYDLFDQRIWIALMLGAFRRISPISPSVISARALAFHVGPDALVWAGEQSSPVLAFPKSHATGPELVPRAVRAPALGLTSHSTYDLFDQRIWIALMLGYLRRITSHFPISYFCPRLFQHCVAQHLDQPLPPILHIAFEQQVLFF